MKRKHRNISKKGKERKHCWKYWKMFRMEIVREGGKPTNERETLEEENLWINTQIWLERTWIKRYTGCVFMGIGAFPPPPLKKRMKQKAKAHTQAHRNTSTTAESIRIDANNIIVELLATFHRFHRCHIYRDARAHSTCDGGHSERCEVVRTIPKKLKISTPFQRENIYFCVIWPCLLLPTLEKCIVCKQCRRSISHLLPFVWLA